MPEARRKHVVKEYVSVRRRRREKWGLRKEEDLGQKFWDIEREFQRINKSKII